jgi:hypothetical protein
MGVRLEFHSFEIMGCVANQYAWSKLGEFQPDTHSGTGLSFEGSVEILTKPFKDPFPSVNRSLHPLIGSIHSKETVGCIVVRVELVRFPPLLEFRLHFRYIRG